MPSPAPRLIDYLPAIYRSDPFIRDYLSAFEAVLLGAEQDSTSPGLETTIANIHRYFDPLQTPREFLTWLAGWTAFTLRADLPESKQRRFIARIIPLYQRRGTPQNLIELLKIFTIGAPTVQEASAPLQIGVRSTIGVNMNLGGGIPHFFTVEIVLRREDTIDPQTLGRQKAIAEALIELEKPAHTHYELKLNFPSMQIGVNSTIGIDTLIGTIPDDSSASE